MKGGEYYVEGEEKKREYRQNQIVNMKNSLRW